MKQQKQTTTTPVGKYEVRYADGTKEFVTLNEINPFIKKEKRKYVIYSSRGEPIYQKSFKG